MITKVEDIIKKAISYIGQTEKLGNSGFIDANFEKLLTSLGWAKPQAWCVYLVMAAVKGFISEDKYKLFSASALTTYNNFKRDNEKSVSMTPTVGSIAIFSMYKDGKETSRGHAAIVLTPVNTSFVSIEGNSNSEGGSEGKEVALLIRSSVKLVKLNGLVLKGFIDLTK